MTPRIVVTIAACTWVSFHALAAPMTLGDRVAAQRAIERVYWNQRIWPAGNPGSKPPLEAVLSDAAILARVETSLRKSTALATRWHRPITGEQLQAELDRMARETRAPETLRALFAALGDDPTRIVETLVRPVLADRLVREWSTPDGSETWRSSSMEADVPSYRYLLPTLGAGTCDPDSWTDTGGNVPQARTGHVSIWTGSEMIVWGGTANGTLATGGRYDPATDTWAPTAVSLFGALARERASAVWTGTEMVIWGGIGNNTGGRYNPTTDTWRRSSFLGSAPAGWWNNTVIWSGSEMIVWGGEATPGTTFASGGRYNPVTDTWTATSTVGAPTARTGHAAVWTGTEMIVWGGRNASGASQQSGGRYNPATDSWSPTSTGANVPAARSGPSAVWTGSRMIVWGGYNGSYLNSGGLYDPASDTWTATSTGVNVPSGRDSHVAVWTGSAMVVWGGQTASAILTNTGGRYDPVANAWAPTPASNAPSARRGHTGIWTGSELIVWGGWSTEANDYASSGGRYAPSSDSWVPTSTAATVPTERYRHTAVWTGAEMIVWGGSTSSSFSRDGGRYDPATASWTPTSTDEGAPTQRNAHSAVWTGTEMIVWGGLGFFPDPPVVATGGRYNPTTDSWTPTSLVGAPSAHSEHSAVWTGTEMIIWGGRDENYAISNSGWRYDPSADAWTATSTVGAPDARHVHSAVWTGSEMIVWGGEDAAFAHCFASGGRYNPATNTWTPTSTGPFAPSAREFHTAIWTGSEMIVWGGEAAPSSSIGLGDGSRYSPDTDTWVPVSTGANVPPPRFGHSAVWTGSEMLVWGGALNGDPYYSNGGGRYDPSSDTWLPIATGSNTPAARHLHTAVWTGSKMIVWGGRVPNDFKLNSGGEYCACPGGKLFYRDRDGDGFGDVRVTAPSCDGVPPPGCVANAGDCNDLDAPMHPGAVESCNGLDDDCNGLVDDGSAGLDADGDAVSGACDNCPFAFNPAQSDSDGDGQGDLCDLDDGVIQVWRDDASSIHWQAETGFTSWNLYLGDLDVLKSSGVYTQAPGSNPLADRRCGLTSSSTTEDGITPAGKVSFSLVTGVVAGVEGSLGSSTVGPRPNANPCP